MRRRLYLMRHGAVSYFDANGMPVAQNGVPLTDEGRAQARAAGTLLRDVSLDRVIATGLPRTMQTAAIVAPELEAEVWHDLRELEAGRLSEIPVESLESEYTRGLRGVVPHEKRFLGGETIGALLDRVLPALDRLVEAADWDTALVVAHGAVNRAILSYALTGEPVFFGQFEQAPGCVNVFDVDDEWIVRAVNIAPTDLLQAGTRLTTMEVSWGQYRGSGAARSRA